VKSAYTFVKVNPVVVKVGTGGATKVYDGLGNITIPGSEGV